MITEDALEVHFGLTLLNRAAEHAYCHNYPSVNQACVDFVKQKNVQLKGHHVPVCIIKIALDLKLSFYLAQIN